MARPKVQFCPRGHDIFAYGRTRQGQCRICNRQRSNPWKKRPENIAKARERE